MNAEERLSDLAVEDVLALINSFQEQVVKEVRNLIKEQFSTVTDRWLVSGLLEYFFSTNNKRILDVLIGAPEPHCKYLLEKISSGLKSGDRFRYISLLLYCISRNPPPIWIYKIPSYILKDLFDVLSPTKDSDISVLVNGVMVLVILLPFLPLEFSKFITKLFECFWKLIFWSPIRDEDLSLKPYLQVAMYSLFHRLYALYPCGLISFLRSRSVGQMNTAWFVSTLKPMLEQVRLHPLLISGNKDTEASRTRWSGMEPNDLIHECAKLCLDPLHEVYEELYCSDSKKHCNLYSECSEYLTLCSNDNTFWSPGNSHSPSANASSVPHTPVYTIQKTTHSLSTKVAESPPEAAIEATPETTPFTSPLPQMNVKNNCASYLNTKSGSSTIGISSNENKFSFPLKLNQDSLLKSDKFNILQNQLSRIQKEQLIVKESLTQSFVEGEINCSISTVTTTSSEKVNCSSAIPMSEINQQEVQNGQHVRKRKLAVIVPKPFIDNEDENSTDLFADDDITAIQSTETSPDVEKNQSNAKVNGEKMFQDNGDEDLNVPAGQSMTELIKSVKTNRLRFLSQCGPPPNISLLNDNGTKKVLSPPNSLPLSLSSSNYKLRRRSYPGYVEIKSEISPSSLRRDGTLSPFCVSPIKCPVEMFEIATQTEDSSIHDPYEQMLEILTLPATERKKQSLLKNESSPYELVDEIMELIYKENNCLPNMDIYWNALSNQSDCKCQNHLRCMYCLLMVERCKREVHADRNRRLLGRIKKLHLLQENNEGLNKEKRELKEEITTLRQSLNTSKDKILKLEETLKGMVDKRSLFEVQKKYSSASLHRDHLQNECYALQSDNASLTKKIENYDSKIKEFQRQLSIHEKHSSQNSILRSQVEELNKRLVIMGEIQLEMRQQIGSNKETQKQAALEALAYEKALFHHRLQESENRHRAEKTSLHAALHRINELEKKLNAQYQQRDKFEREKEYLVLSLEEKCAALQKRNKEICAINSTLESQMQRFTYLSHTSESEKLLSNNLGTSLPSTKPESVISLSTMSEPSPKSFLGQNTIKDFGFTQLPKPQKSFNNSS